jgi:hypothetical protein
MVNRGNIALQEKDLNAAERWFRQALAARPEYASALDGLRRVEQSR